MKNSIYQKHLEHPENLKHQKQKKRNLVMALLVALFLFSCGSDEPDDSNNMPDSAPDLVCKAESGTNCQEIFLTNAGVGCPEGLTRSAERCIGEKLAICDNGAGIRWDYFGYDAFQLAREQETCEGRGDTWMPQAKPPASPGVNITPSGGITTESEGEVTLSLVLTSQPTADVTITPESRDTTEGTVSGALIFTPENWNTEQEITVTGRNDDIADGTQTYQITFTVSSGDTSYNGLELSPVEMMNTDNETVGITLIVIDPTTNESGETGTIRMVLNTQPMADVTITPESSDTGEGAVSEALIFTPSNWDTQQTITVTGQDDNIADGTQTYEVTFTVSSDDTSYNGFSLRAVEMMNTDNDMAGITLTPNNDSTTSESGGTVTISVELMAQPEADVMVMPVSSDPMEGIVMNATLGESLPLTFTPDNWNTPQMVTVTGQDDNIDDGNKMYMITFMVSSEGDTNYAGLTGRVDLTNTDDDTATLRVSPNPATVGEGAGTVTYTVSLSLQPGADVMVNYHVLDGSMANMATEGYDYTDAIGMLTLTESNWSTGVTVVVSIVSDDEDEDDETFTLTLSDPSDNSELASVTTTIIDDDTSGVKVVDTDSMMMGDQTSLTVGEGSAATYMVVLTSRPTGEVTVTPTVPQNTDVTVSPTSLTFTAVDPNNPGNPGNWDTPQTVTVTAAQDDDAVNDTVLLTNTASGGDYDSVMAATVMVTVTDTDTRGVMASKTALSVTEGSTGTYTVALATQPTGNVTVTVTGASGDVSVSPSSLTFTSSNWNTAQTVTVTADQDEDAAADAVVMLTNTASGGDYTTESATVTVTIVEDDKSTFSVTGPASVGEGDGTATYTVSLSAQPSSNVMVDYRTANVTAMAGSDSDSDYTAANGTLTFTPTNWNTAQTVNVTILDDLVDDDGENFTFTLSNARPSANAQLSGSPSVTTTIVDDDDPTVTASFGSATYTVAEGSTGNTVNVTVTLSVEPERSVIIPLTVGGTATSGDDFSGVPESVTFEANETSKMFTLTARDNSVAEPDETVTLAFGTLPDRVTAGSIASTTVTITDNDTRGIIVDTNTMMMGDQNTTLMVMEGSTTIYTVKLNSQPAGEVTVTVGGASADITVSPTSLIFTPENPDPSETGKTRWDTTQTVTVTAEQDDDAAEETVTLTHSVSSVSEGTYVVLPANAPSVTVTTIEDEMATFMVTGPTITMVGEGAGMVTYRVSLSAQPGENVMVDYATSDDTAMAGSDYTAVAGNSMSSTPDPLTFTPSNWDTVQEVMVTITDDSLDEGDETFNFTLSNATGGAVFPSGATSLSVATTIVDNDRTVSFGAASYRVRGGEMVDITITLSRAPGMGNSVTIPLTVGGTATATGANADFSGVPASVTFGANETSQTFTLMATDDDEEMNETVILGFGTLPNTMSNQVKGGATASATVTIIGERKVYAPFPFDTTGLQAYVAYVTVGTWTPGSPGSCSVGVSTTQQACEEPLPRRDTASSDSAGWAVMSFDSAESTNSGAPYSIWSADIPTGDNIRFAFFINEDLADGVDNNEANHRMNLVGAFGRLANDAYREFSGSDVITEPGSTPFIFLPANTGPPEEPYFSGALSERPDCSDPTPMSDTMMINEDFCLPLKISPSAGMKYAYLSFLGDTDGYTFTVRYTINGEEPTSGTSAPAPVTANFYGNLTLEGSPANRVWRASLPDNDMLKFTVYIDTDGDSDIDGRLSRKGYEAGSSFADDGTPGVAFGNTDCQTTMQSARVAQEYRICNNNNVRLMISFGRPTYSVMEGEMVNVTVNLSMDPGRTVTIPLTATLGTGATSGDYTAPASVEFMSGETSKTVTFMAASDSVDESDETVVLDFGTLPAGVWPGATTSTTVTIEAPDTGPTTRKVYAPFPFDTTGLQAYVVYVTAGTWTDGSPGSCSDGVSTTQQACEPLPRRDTASSDSAGSVVMTAPANFTDPYSIWSADIPTGDNIRFVFFINDDLADGVENNDANHKTNLAGAFGRLANDAYREYSGSDVICGVDTEAMCATGGNGDVPNTAFKVWGNPGLQPYFSGALSERPDCSSNDPTNANFCLALKVKAPDGTDGDGNAVAMKYVYLSFLFDTGPHEVTVRHTTDGSTYSTTGASFYAGINLGGSEQPNRVWRASIPDNADLKYTVEIKDSGAAGPFARLSRKGYQLGSTFSGDDADDAVGVALDNTDCQTTMQAARVAPRYRLCNARNVKPIVSFGAATYDVSEGSTVSITVTLNIAPGEGNSLSVPLSVMVGADVTDSEYSVAASVEFMSGETSKTVTFMATDDELVESSGETVTLNFGTLPAGVTAGSTASTTVTITDE